MNEEEIAKIWDDHVTVLNTENVLAFTRAIEAKVREKCAVTCDRLENKFLVQEDLLPPEMSPSASTGAWECAEAIRARGKDER